MVAALCLCQAGATVGSMACMVCTLHRMWHHMCTAFGDSQRLNGWCEWAQVTVMHNCSCPNHPAEVAQCMQTSVATWGTLLSTTGGCWSQRNFLVYSQFWFCGFQVDIWYEHIPNTTRGLQCQRATNAHTTVGSDGAFMYSWSLGNTQW